jgi:hypothetical protein
MIWGADSTPTLADFRLAALIPLTPKLGPLIRFFIKNWAVR